MSDVLVLNSNYQAVNLASIERAATLLFGGRAEAVPAVEPAGVLRSPSLTFRVPSVIRMLSRREWQRKVRLTRDNIFKRDGNACQYCGTTRERMTIDHVFPRSRGGRNTWENLVSACERCNGRKNNRTPDEAKMKLLRRPRRPIWETFIVIERNPIPESWKPFVFRMEERIA